MAREKTYHRWTDEQDKKLLAFVRSRADDFNSIGKPGGIARDLFWSQAPGKLDLPVTPTACQMRYRTLTSDTEWAATRRTEQAHKLAKRERMEIARKKREEAQKLLDEMGESRDDFSSGASEELREDMRAMREAMQEQNAMIKKLLEVWTKS